jgi:hypothetical protein
MEAGGRLGDARFVSDRDEGAQMSEIHGGRFYTRSEYLASKVVLDSERSLSEG